MSRPFTYSKTLTGACGGVIFIGMTASSVSAVDEKTFNCVNEFLMSICNVEDDNYKGPAKRLKEYSLNLYLKFIDFCIKNFENYDGMRESIEFLSHIIYNKNFIVIGDIEDLRNRYAEIIKVKNVTEPYVKKEYNASTNCLDAAVENINKYVTHCACSVTEERIAKRVFYDFCNKMVLLREILANRGQNLPLFKGVAKDSLLFGYEDANRCLEKKIEDAEKSENMSENKEDCIRKLKEDKAEKEIGYNQLGAELWGAILQLTKYKMNFSPIKDYFVPLRKIFCAKNNEISMDPNSNHRILFKRDIFFGSRLSAKGYVYEKQGFIHYKFKYWNLELKREVEQEQFIKLNPLLCRWILETVKAKNTDKVIVDKSLEKNNVLAENKDKKLLNKKCNREVSPVAKKQSVLFKVMKFDLSTSAKQNLVGNKSEERGIELDEDKGDEEVKKDDSKGIGKKTKFFEITKIAKNGIQGTQIGDIKSDVY